MESQNFQRLEDWRSCAHVLQHHGRPSYLETSCLANMLQRSCFLRSKIRCSLSAMVLSRSLISFSLESLSWSSQKKHSMEPVSSVLPKNKKKLFAQIYCTSGRIAKFKNNEWCQKEARLHQAQNAFFCFSAIVGFLLDFFFPLRHVCLPQTKVRKNHPAKKFPMAPWTIRVSFHGPRGMRPIRITGIQHQLNRKSQLL